MNTEQLTQFPMGVITEADIKEHEAANQRVTEDSKTLLQMVAIVLLGTVAVGIIGAFTMSATLSSRMTRIESTKALLLTLVAPEKCENFINKHRRPVIPQR